MIFTKVFKLVKPFLGNLHSTSSKKDLYVRNTGMKSMTPKNTFLSFADEYQKYAEFYADFKSVEIISVPKKSSLPKTFSLSQVDSIEGGQTLILHTFYAYTFYISNFSY
jgi:hypothetical protein